MAVEAPAPPAPAAPAAPAPAPEPSISTIPKGLAALRAKVETIAVDPGGKDGPQPKAKATPAPDKPEEKKPDVKAPDQKPDAKLEPPKPPDKPAEVKPDGKPKKDTDFLREELAKHKARAEALEAEITKFKTTKTEDPEKKALSEKLTKAEQRAKEIEDELRFANYERSPEFKEKYAKPYETAWVEAMSDLEETVVPNQDGSLRKATKDDLMKIINLPIQQAGELAEQLFGKAERTMMDHRSSILKTWKAQQNAIVEGRKMAEQREKELTEQHTKQQSELRKLQSELRSTKEPDFLKRHPELAVTMDAKGEPVDKEFAELLQRDRSVTDNLFNEESKLAPEKKLELHAEMRNRAAHFGAVLKLARKAVTELAELKQKLAEYEKSEPVPGDGVKEVLPELKDAVSMKGLMGRVAAIAREK